MQLFGRMIHRASYLRKKIDQATIAKITGRYVDEKAYWYIIGVYESRLFGLCIYRTDDSSWKVASTPTDERCQRRER